MHTRILTPVLVAAFLSGSASGAFAQERPVQFRNPLEGALPGSTEKPETRRATDRKILDSHKAGRGWVVVSEKTESLDKKSFQVRYRKVENVHVEADDGKGVMPVLTLGPPSPWINVQTPKFAEDGPAADIEAACKAKIAALEPIIKTGRAEGKNVAGLIEQQNSLETLVKLLAKK